MKNKLRIGIAWFNESDWDEWKRISEDELEESYEDWLIEATIAKKDLEDNGFIVAKVTITPEKFKIWCKKNFKKLNSGSRSHYVAELLRDADSKN